MKIILREATETDLEWINSQYREIKFLKSNLVDEKIILAKVDGENAGMGRIKKVNENDAELGGIYILPKFRKYGIARIVVSELVKLGYDYNWIFCLPYEHLKKFYESFGFEDLNNDDDIPEEIRKKIEFCKSTYEFNVLLLVRRLER